MKFLEKISVGGVELGKIARMGVGAEVGMSHMLAGVARLLDEFDHVVREIKGDGRDSWIIDGGPRKECES